jgi:N-acetylneuraminate lyase
MITKLLGLVAATHTPFDRDGQLNLDVVEKQAEHLLRNRLTCVFLGGSTGESHSLSLAERFALTERWAAVCRGTPLKIVVHVGGNCLTDACQLAPQAQQLGVAAIAALAPSYFKPRTLSDLVECCRMIAAAAPALPFYFYDIPVLTGVRFPMPEFLETAADRIPTLGGIKFTNPDLMAFQRCLRVQDGRFDVLWGMDEHLLAALALGGLGAVGSSYNFTAPIYHRMMTAFQEGNWAVAREEQFRGVRLIQVLSDFGYIAAAKVVMEWLGVPVGPPRLPIVPLTSSQQKELQTILKGMGYFDWLVEKS